MQSISINRDKIDSKALYKGKSGTYLNLTLIENRDGPDQYGNDGFVVQDIGKERRAQGEKGPIVGNWKHVGQRQQEPASQHSSRQEQPDDAEDDIPF